ncbi:MAG TPA: GNAT family N-acetyltransferase [Anaerolineae bacterium]|nr:GNAT family N-acetyltransferase [Anaerolineae bacterium]
MWTIRRYQPSDRSAVRRLAGDTAHFGEPIERFFDAREVFLDAFANFYTDVAYNYLWVALENSATHDDSTTLDDGELIGYLMGCPDTRDYEAWFRSNVKHVAWRAVTWRYRGVFTRKSLGYIRRYLRLRLPYIDLSPYPAHLHINTRADRRGTGIGTALMKTYLDQLRTENIPGVHLETSSENKIAVPWYERLGFRRLQSVPTDVYQHSVGHAVDLYLYAMRLM